MIHHSHEIGLFSHFHKLGLIQRHHSWRGGNSHVPPQVNFKTVSALVLCVVNHDSIHPQSAPSPSDSLQGKDGNVVVADCSHLSPGYGTLGVVDKLTSEASESLSALEKLGADIGNMKEGLKREASNDHEVQILKPTLELLSGLQRETTASIASSKRVLEAHGKFCFHMQETLQHAATGKDHLLMHDSKVVAAGKDVDHAFETLDKDIGKVQASLHDVVQELLQLGMNACAILHSHVHSLWEKVQSKLLEIMSAITSVISHLSTILSFFHPVFHIIGGIAGGVHEFLNKLKEHFCSCLHGHSNLDGVHPDEKTLEILRTISENMPRRQDIQHARDQSKDVCDNMEKPMMELEEGLEKHCVYVKQQDAWDAAEKWGELREKLGTIITKHQCKA